MNFIHRPNQPFFFVLFFVHPRFTIIQNSFASGDITNNNNKPSQRVGLLMYSILLLLLNAYYNFFYWNVRFFMCFCCYGVWYCCSELTTFIIKIKKKNYLSEWNFTAGCFSVKYKIKRLWSYGSYNVKLLMLTFRA